MIRDPFEVFGVGLDVDDETIRRRYLELVRRHSPERDPERFAAIREAYELLRGREGRLRYLLFEMGKRESIDDLLAEAKGSTFRRRLPTELLLSLGRET
jgi:curved DNA-binding protein CbpA